MAARRLRQADLAVIFGNLAAMLEAGISLARSLDALSREGADPPVAELCAALLRSVQRGTPLSTAMNEHSEAFTILHARAVQAGERSGRLPQVLRELARWEERDLALMRAVTGSLTYPLTVFVAGVGMVTMVGDRIFATLGPILQASGKPLPLLTQILCTTSALLKSPLVLVGLVLLIGAGGMGLRAWLQSDDGRYRFDQLQARLPAFGLLLRKIFVARFCHHLSLLYSSGIPLMSALQTTTGLVSNAWMRARVSIAAQRLGDGLTLTESLEETRLFPRLALGLIGVGEQSGRLDALLSKVASQCDEEVYQTLDTVVQLLEPAVIGAMGVVVALIVLGTLLPLYSVISV